MNQKTAGKLEGGVVVMLVLLLFTGFTLPKSNAQFVAVDPDSREANPKGPLYYNYNSDTFSKIESSDSGFLEKNVFSKTGIKTSVNSIGSVQQVIQDIIGWVQVFILVISVLFIIMGAWDYLNSGGEAEKTKEARTKVIYAVVAIAVALIAGGVDSLVDTFVN